MSSKPTKGRFRNMLRPARRSLSSVLRLLPISSVKLGPPRGVIESTAEWFRTSKAEGCETFRVAESMRVTRKPPRTLGGDVHEKFRPFLDQIHPAAEVYSFKEGRLVHLCAVTPDDYILKDISIHKEAADSEFDWVMSSVKLPPARRISGNLTVIGEGYGSSYYHWLFHAVGRLCHVKKKFPLESFSAFAVSHYTGYQKESLDLLGIPAEKIRLTKDLEHMAPDTLTVANWTGRFDPNIALFLRDTFLPHAAKSGGPKRIYLSRSKASSRQVVNEPEILAVLSSLGFTTVYCEGMSLKEQVSLFHGAEAIVGPHGAAFSNVVFCRPGTKVIELFSPIWRNELYWQLSEAVGLDYSCLDGKEAPSKAGSLPHLKNLTVSPEELRKLLKLAGITG